MAVHLGEQNIGEFFYYYVKNVITVCSLDEERGHHASRVTLKLIGNLYSSNIIFFEQLSNKLQKKSHASTFSRTG